MGKVIEFSKFKSKNNDNKIINATTDSSNNRLYILIGIPCSGKSTYAANIILKKPNALIIATDEIRKKLTGTYKFSLDSNKMVFDIAKKMIDEALKQGFDVVFDATNTNKKYRNSIISIAKRNNFKIFAIVFKTPLKICLKRNSKRSLEKIVPEDIIVAMSKYADISKLEGFEEVIDIF